MTAYDFLSEHWISICILIVFIVAVWAEK